jgi:DNA-binding NarL/FixJ family response regulator
MTKVLIADDHPLFRHGLKQLLLSVSAQWLIDEAGNGQEILDRVWREDYDLVFLDIGLPGRGGLEILEEIMRAKPETRVLILSMYAEDQLATPAMKAGAAGYITKDCEPQELMDAVKRVLKGEAYFHTGALKKLTAEIRDGAQKAPHERLSGREHEIMRLIVKGEKLSKIAKQLAISKSAVSAYRSRILKKMGMKSNSEIIKYAVKAGLFD